MSRPTFASSHSTPNMSHPTPSMTSRPPLGWPVYDPYSTLKRRDTTPPTLPSQYSKALVSSSTSLKLVSQKQQPPAAISSQSAHSIYHIWTPPTRSASPDSELAWSQREGDSTSSTSTSSDSEDDSPAETSLTIVPKQASKSLAAVEKDLQTELYTQSHFSNILMATRTGSNPNVNANSASAMQLLAYRSPSVRYDKGLHGAFSPATTVHLALPHAAAIRAQGKPRLPLPASAKAMPRPLQPHQQQQQQPQQPQKQNTPLQHQFPRQRVISQPPPRSVASVSSPAVIGLDLALMPPADHRDSAMSPRNSVAVKTPARPSLLAPVDIPRRVSIGSTQGHTVWKPISAPTSSPISEGPPQPSIITHGPPAATPIDTPKLPGPPSSSSVSITSSVGSATPSVQAPASNNSSTSALDNERAEISARTLSSTDLAQRFKSDPPPQSREVSPKITVQHLDNSTESVPLQAVPVPVFARPAPTPIQPTIMLPTDEVEYDESRAPLRVINVTNDYAADSMATVPTTIHAPAEAPVPPAPARSPSPVPDITVVPSTPPVDMQQFLGPNFPFPPTNRSSISPAPSPILPEIKNKFPKHASLPPSARLHTQSTPMLQTPRASRASMDTQAASASYTGTPERRPVSRAPRLPPPGSRTWLPRNLTVPTPLSPTSTLPQQTPQQPPQALPQAPQAPQPFPSHHHQQQQPQSSRRISATQQQVRGPSPSRHQHVHTKSDPPPTPMRSHRPLTAPIRPFASNTSGYYSSDDDDPSKWAPYPDPEVPSSRRSSRSSYSRNSRNSRASGRGSIYGLNADDEEEDGGLLYAPPSISLPNLRPILQQGLGDSDLGLGRKITFAVPHTESNKPSQAAGGRRRIRRRSNSTDSVLRGPKQIPWLQESDIPKRGGLVTVADPFGYTYADEGRYDAVNHPELIPADVYSRYVHSDGGPKLPEYRETFSSKSNAQRAAAEEESRARILGRKTRTPAVSVQAEEEVPITVPVCLRRPRAMSESASGDELGHRKSGSGNPGGSKLRRRSRSRDRTADWAPPPTIPDPEIPPYPLYSMPPTSNSLFPSMMERMFNKLRR